MRGMGEGRKRWDGEGDGMKGESRMRGSNDGKGMCERKRSEEKGRNESE